MKIVFDTKLKRPGCALLQAAMGGSVPNFNQLFPAETWLVSPTPDMHAYDVTESQLKQLVAMALRAIEPKALVVHWKKERYDVYIGRPGPFANPFRTGADGTREEVIAKFEAWLLDQPDFVQRVKRELRGKVLGCWCRPEKPCHGDVLARIANE